MDSRWRIEPAEEARHQEVMAGLGVHGAEWALWKVLEVSDVDAGQNRLLLLRDMVRGGPIPKLFPELEELDVDGRNAERTVSFTLLDAEGREKELSLRYLNSNKAYRVFGPEWRRFVKDSGMCKGDRVDLYACKRGDEDQRCLFLFTGKGGGGSGGSAWCTIKRARQPAATAAAVRDHKRRGKSRRAEREDHMLYVMDDGVHGGFQRDYGCCKSLERTRREDKAPLRLWIDSTKEEREAAKGLLMLRYAILAKYYR
ncbi:uncharacterized protein LOC124664068 [Lolium rigidum]|uniref:uncharacterized protein LOC124664068 n=1 Tax=Lolium rigidum TaxID=89674 RepID=UPI001F5D8991|nr:uncharacterized protein LOC124664068 [Lolium rigidum]